MSMLEDFYKSLLTPTPQQKESIKEFLNFDRTQRIIARVDSNNHPNPRKRHQAKRK